MKSGPIFWKESMLKRNDYLLMYHDCYFQRIRKLKARLKELKAELPHEEYVRHELVKFAARIRNADQKIIPEDPNKQEYRLKGDLKKFRRYKQGLKRYRLFFCFANTPRIILYLYLNDEKHLRKQGDRNDPYEAFTRLVKNGTFSHDPADAKIQQWIHDVL